LVLSDFSVPVRQIVYPSGLRVVAERDAWAATAAVFLLVGSGASADPPGKEGMAHFVEHLSFRARPFGKSTFRRLMELAGSSAMNGFTDHDTVVYAELGPASALHEMLRLEGARIVAPVARVEPEAFAAELNVVRSELRQDNETGASGEVTGSIETRLFPPGHAYARPVIGTHASLATITADDVSVYVATHYRPSNMTLVITGNVDLATIDRTLSQSLPPAALAASAISATQPRRLPAVAPEPPAPPAGPLLVRKEAAVPTPELWIGWSLPRAIGPERYLLSFVDDDVSAALGDARERDDDIAGVVTSAVSGNEGSMLLCRVRLKHALHPQRSLERVLDQLHKTWGRPESVEDIRARELEFQKRQRTAAVGLLLQLEHPIARGFALANSGHTGEGIDAISRALNGLLELEPRHVAAYTSKYLTRERARAILFEPGGAAAPPAPLEIRAALADEALPLVHVDANRLRAAFGAPDVRRYRQLTLPNGLRIVLGRRSGIPTVSAVLTLGGGRQATTDPAAAELARVYSQATNRDHGDPRLFGASLNEDADFDSHSYSIDAASGNVGIMLAILAERVRSREIPSGIWSRFERDRLQYIRIAETRPEALTERAFWSAMFAGHAYARQPTAEAMANTGEAAAQRWLDSTHVPRNAVLAVVGDVRLAEVERIVVDRFGGWSDDGPEASRPPPARPYSDPRSPPRLIVTPRAGATQGQLRFACVLPPSPDAATDVRHDVAAAIAEHRLGSALRERLGVTYGVDVSAVALRGGTAYLHVSGAVESVRLFETIEAVRQLLTSLAQTTAPPNELAWAKLRLASGGIGRFLTNASIASTLARRAELGWGVASVERYPDELAAVTADQVRDDFRRCLTGRPTMAITGDERTARDAFARAWK
jgi:zinc protease